MRSNRSLIGLTVLALAFASLPAAADFETAMNYFKSSKYLEAAGEFQALVDENPDYADGYYMLAICFMKTNKLADAEKNLLKAVELNGDKFEYHFNLANVFMKSKKYDKVIGTLNNAEGLAENEQYKQAVYKLRGFAEAQRGDWEAAIGDLARVRPDADVTTQLGKAYFSLGDNEKAADTLAEASKANPKDAEVRRLRTEALMNLAAKSNAAGAKKSLYGQAVTEAKEFQKLKAGTFEGDYLVGRASLGAGSYDLAISSFKAALAKDGKKCNAMINLGKAYIGKKDWGNATVELDKAAKCNSKVPTVWENLGFALQKQEKLEAAVEKYDMALQLNPGSSFAQKNKQICLQNIEIRDHNTQMDRAAEEQQAKIAEAEEEYRKAKEKEEEWKKLQEEDD